MTVQWTLRELRFHFEKLQREHNDPVATSVLEMFAELESMGVCMDSLPKDLSENINYL